MSCVLMQGVPLTKETFPVCLPTGASSEQPVGEVCYVTGWGSLGLFVSTKVSKLRQAPSTIYDQNHCNKIYNGQLTEAMFCGYSRLRDTCQGDSGMRMLTAFAVHGDR